MGFLRVQRDTAPIIRYIRWLSWTNTIVKAFPLKQCCFSLVILCAKPQRLVMMADRDDGTSAAMRRRQRRLRSWWRHEQRSVAAALAAATHHSAPRSGWPEQHNAPRGPTTASAMEVEAHEQYYAPRGQEQPPPGVRPAPLSEVAGPQAAVTVGYVAAVAPSLAVVPVSDLLHDDATVQFLLQQSLLARAQEEEEAREQEEVKRMEEAVVTKMQRLEAEVQMYAGQDLSQLSDLERAAVFLVARSDALRRRRERRRKRKKQRKKKLPRAPRPRCQRPCARQRQVPAVQVVHSVHRQSVGHSCYACRDVYPQCKLCRRPSFLQMLFLDSVSAWHWWCLFGSSPNLDTKHTFYEFCLPSERGCVAMLCGGGFCSSDGAYDSV